MVRHYDGSLHYTVNGEDQGVACDGIPPGIYAVIDLYGQTAQVSVVHGSAGQQLGQPCQLAAQENNSVASSQVS